MAHAPSLTMACIFEPTLGRASPIRVGMWLHRRAAGGKEDAPSQKVTTLMAVVTSWPAFFGNQLPASKKLTNAFRDYSRSLWLHLTNSAVVLRSSVPETTTSMGNATTERGRMIGTIATKRST